MKRIITLAFALLASTPALAQNWTIIEAHPGFHTVQIGGYPNGVNIWSPTEYGRFNAQDSVISRTLAPRSYFLGTHGDIGRPSLLPTDRLMQLLRPGANQNVVFNATCNTGLRVCGVPGTSLNELEVSHFGRLGRGVAAVGPNGVVSFTNVYNVNGQATAYFEVATPVTRRVLPGERAFTTDGMLGGRSPTRISAVENLLGQRGEVRWIYGRPPANATLHPNFPTIKPGPAPTSMIRRVGSPALMVLLANDEVTGFLGETIKESGDYWRERHPQWARDADNWVGENVAPVTDRLANNPIVDSVMDPVEGFFSLLRFSFRDGWTGKWQKANGKPVWSFDYDRNNKPGVCP